VTWVAVRCLGADGGAWARGEARWGPGWRRRQAGATLFGPQARREPHKRSSFRGLRRTSGYGSPQTRPMPSPSVSCSAHSIKVQTPQPPDHSSRLSMTPLSQRFFSRTHPVSNVAVSYPKGTHLIRVAVLPLWPTPSLLDSTSSLPRMAGGDGAAERPSPQHARILLQGDRRDFVLVPSPRL